MKEITISHLRTRYPRSYDDLLQLLDVRGYNTAALKLAGIRFVQVFTTKRKRYFCFQVGMETSLFGSVNWDLTKEADYSDCYVLTIASSGMVEEDGLGSGAGSLAVERLEYEVYVKGRRAEFANNTSCSGPASIELIKLFLRCLDRMVDIDVTSIRIFDEDTALKERLCEAGFEITAQDLGCTTVTKNIKGPAEPIQSTER
jgi:hypothetical protein